MAVIIKGIDILEPSAGTNSLQWAWQNGGPASGEVLIFGENGLLTNGTPVIPESTGTTTSSSVDVTEFYPTDMNAADNLSNYPGFTNAMYFNGSNDYLSSSSSFGTPTSTTKRTFSFWAKFGKVGAGQVFSNPNNGLNEIRFNGDNATANYAYTMEWFEDSGNSGLVFPYAKYRDTSSWYHFVCVMDSTISDSMKIYKNGIEESLVIAVNLPTGSATIRLGDAQTHYIGARNSSTGRFNGYLANIHFIDGQALDASYFGQYLMDADGNPTSAWAPKLFDGTSSTGGADVTNDYGTNGFLLDFSKLGLDSSGDIDKVYDTAPISGSHSAANDWTAH